MLTQYDDKTIHQYHGAEQWLLLKQVLIVIKKRLTRIMDRLLITLITQLEQAKTKDKSGTGA
tara:strand:+ start:1580 stop:1765 length:186 start_codon:yes stop_codon:yes gene_type:complete